MQAQVCLASLNGDICFSKATPRSMTLNRAQGSSSNLIPFNLGYENAPALEGICAWVRVTLGKPSSWHYACQEMVSLLGRMISWKLVGCKLQLPLCAVLAGMPHYTHSMCFLNFQKLCTHNCLWTERELG